MKKLIVTTALLAAVMFAKAQLKVYQSGKTYFGGTSTTPNSLVAIGAAGNSLFQLYSYQSSTTQGVAAIQGEVVTPTGSNSSYGLIGAITSGAGYAYGIKGTSYNGTAQSAGQAYGVYGQAGNATSGYNYGVWGRLLGSNNGAGIYGGNSGPAYIPGQYAAYFDGNIRTTDATPEKPTDAYWTIVSDSRAKKNVTDFTDGLNVIRQVKTINFEYNGIGQLPAGIPGIGIIAQDVQKVAPYCIGKTAIVVNDNEKASFANDIIQTIQNDSAGKIHIAEALNFNPNGLFWAGNL